MIARLANHYEKLNPNANHFSREPARRGRAGSIRAFLSEVHVELVAILTEAAQ